MPRRVPFWALRELFTWQKWVDNWCVANSFSQKARAKKPRSSPRFSRSITNAPLSGVSVKIIRSLLNLVQGLLDRAQSHELIALEVLLRESMLDHFAVQFL